MNKIIFDVKNINGTRKIAAYYGSCKNNSRVELS